MEAFLSWTNLFMAGLGIFIGHALGKKREKDNRDYQALVPLKEKLYLALDNERCHVSPQAPTKDDIHRACARLSKNRANELRVLFKEYSDSQKPCLRADEYGQPNYTAAQMSRYRLAADKLLAEL
ncbi:hypothetical protein HME01_32500 [Vreelandella aquamarina]|uniref:Uncharacterized protein n=1 Tax=Vreelandella aquamarina TaxID=77097 RepID=A0A1N6DNQ3_9GAMM|nr:hypothetical protein [Halomonas meridiana]GED47398.1 hypothetical protein HME01_32500 [Halomonas meridiana]SIN62332.1 hypothetical protein SAMN05878438_0855 [Halomonas meridiana]SIN72293.1 hypothetical protein SAMN05878249_3072 [Halomonas meridiana]SIO21270.1 hypothetical protein SAMN05878442_1532 [Halomonas meridiana]